MPPWLRLPVAVPMALGRNAPGSRRARAVPILLLVAAVVLAACATGPQRRPTFVGRAAGLRVRLDVAAGLNPLASLDTCQAEVAAGPAPRVLVSPPEYFSKDATDMILALREALALEQEAQHVQMWLATQPLYDEPAAASEGRRCGAMIVLWERFGTNTLELTMTEEALVPLRNRVRNRLCEFGNHRQQANILFLTIIGLAAMLDNRYNDAVYYVDAANRIDVDCLQLPGMPAPDLGDEALPVDGGISGDSP